MSDEADKQQEKAPAKRRKGGQKGYPDSFVRYVRTLWASGSFDTDIELGEFCGVPAPTIRHWRAEKRPDGIDWHELRRELSRQRQELLTKEAAETQAGLVRRYRAVVSALIRAALAFARGEKVYDEKGNPILLPELAPRSFGEAVQMVIRLINLDMMLSEVVDDTFDIMDKAAMLVRQAMEQADIPVEMRQKVADQLMRLISGAELQDNGGPGVGTKDS